MRGSPTLALAMLLLSAVPASPQSTRQERLRQVQQAEILQRGGQLSRALATLESVLAEAPAEVRAVLLYERIRRRQGQLDAAIPVLERAIEADPRSAVYRQIHLMALVDLARLTEVREAGADWLRVAPASEQAYLDFAAALQRLGQRREAESVLLRGSKAVERPLGVAARLADLFLEEGRWAEAAEQWLVVLADSPASGLDLIIQRLGAIGPDAPSIAREILTRLASPSTTGELKLAAIAALFGGQPEAARAHAEAALDEMAAEERPAFVNRFSMLAASRAEPALVAWAYRQQFLHSTPDSLRWNLTRQIVQHDLTAGDTTAALSALNDLLSRVETGTPAHRWASGTQIRLYAAALELERAEAALQRYVEHYPDGRQLAPLALALAEANLRRGRLQEAERVLERVPEGELTPNERARLAAARGFLALYDGRYPDAQRDLEAAAARLSGAERGDALRVLRFLRGADKTELRAVADAHRALREKGPAEAYERLTRRLDDGSASSVRPALLLWAGELALEAKKANRAEEVLRRIVERYPAAGEAPVALVTLAESLAARDRREEAIALLERLILDYPESALTPLGRRRLAELREEVPRS